VGRYQLPISAEGDVMSEQRVGTYNVPVNVQPSCYSVDDLLIEVDRRRVSRQGREIRLGRLTFDLLAILVQGAPELISAPSLMKQLWPDSSVDRETVTQRVIALRAALGDDAKKVRYIASVRGSGYRLVANVQSLVRVDRLTDPIRLRAILRSN
jgi:DNA-binding winged helix-turn-helix (wHTH) protein